MRIYPKRIKGSGKNREKEKTAARDPKHRWNTRQSGSRRQNMKQKELLQRIWEFGIDMDAPALSKIEGQSRYVTDYELLAIAESLNVSVGWLLGRDAR